MTNTITPSNGVVTAIPLDIADIREGLRLERAFSMAHDLMHAAESDRTRYIVHIGAMYGVPPGWQLRDWLRGFEPPQEGKQDG